MTVFQRIVKILETFEYPCEPDLYKGSAKKYFTYNYADERGALFGDDEPENVIADIQVHFFLPADENFIREKNEIRKALFLGGFTFPEVIIMTEDSGKKRHIVFECQCEEET